MMPIAALRMRNPSAGGGGGDPYFSSVKLLMGFEGTNGSTSFVDESASPHTMTANGNAQISTAQFKFGTSSAVFDGSGDFISTPDSADWDFGSGAFTVEMFIRQSASTNNKALIGQWDNAGTFSNCAWFLWIDSGFLKMSLASGGSKVDLSVAWTTGAALDTWYHVAYDRDATGKARLYKDGVLQTSNATSHNFTINNSNNSLTIGRIGTGTTFSSYDNNGYMDEVRVTKGVARYASDSGFTVPASAYPRS